MDEWVLKTHGLVVDQIQEVFEIVPLSRAASVLRGIFLQIRFRPLEDVYRPSAGKKAPGTVSRQRVLHRPRRSQAGEVQTWRVMKTAFVFEDQV